MQKPTEIPNKIVCPMYKTSTFYEAVACLMYAIAMADRSITRDEKLKIIALIKKHWSTRIAPFNEQERIYKTLRELISKNEEAQRAFLIFTEHYFRNKKHYDAPLKAKIFEACDTIATKKGKRSKMELILLSKLNALFYPYEE